MHKSVRKRGKHLIIIQGTYYSSKVVYLQIYNSSIIQEQPERKAGSLSRDIRNISSCIAYGCHSFQDQLRLTENSTCSVEGNNCLVKINVDVML